MGIPYVLFSGLSESPVKSCISLCARTQEVTKYRTWRPCKVLALDKATYAYPSSNTLDRETSEQSNVIPCEWGGEGRGGSAFHTLSIMTLACVFLTMN